MINPKIPDRLISQQNKAIRSTLKSIGKEPNIQSNIKVASDSQKPSPKTGEPKKSTFSIPSMTRRTFFKTSAVVAGGVWASSALACAPAPSATDENPAGVEQVFQCVCKPNCFESCHINVHVREGKAVKTSMAPFPDPAFNRICHRGLSHVGNIYDPDRVLYPLKRAGARGADQWERISWDEAISEIAEKFESYQKEYGPESIVMSAVSGNYGSINGGYTSAFASAINASTMSANLDMSNAIGLNRVVGWAGIWLGSEIADMKNAKHVFFWGNNVTDAQIQEWHFVADAIEAGVDTIVIDPIYTQLASKAAQFVPIRPAADAALILSMMNVIIAEDRINPEFMLAHTVAPFLVRKDTGKFLRMSDLGVEPTKGPEDPDTGKATVIDPVAVWDATENKAVALEDAKNPSLEGEFTADSIVCTTAYTLLKNEVAIYTPEYASPLCDVSVEKINELSQLATDGPVFHRVGWGAQAYDNGVHPHHAGAALAAITGQIGFPGAVYGTADWNTYYGFNAAMTAAGEVTSPTIASLVLPDVVKSGKFKGEDITIKALYCYQGNPLCTFVDSNRFMDMMNSIEFIVTVDLMLTDTARYSDIVLPCAHFFEYEDVVGQGPCNHVIHSDKAIDSPGEAKPDYEIMSLLAEKMGLNIFSWADSKEWLEEYIDTEISAALGISYAGLQEGPIRWLAGSSEEPYVRWADYRFFTPSGRMEFYLEDPLPQSDMGQVVDLERERLPRFFPPKEAWPDNPLYATYPFVLMSERPRFRVHGQWFNNRYLRELDPYPTVKINPQDALTKGINNGDLVECFNDRGMAVAVASLNDAIRPGTLVYPKSWQINQHVAGGWSELSSSSFEPVAVNQSFMDELCDIRLWEGAVS